MTTARPSSQATLSIGFPALAKFDNFVSDGNEHALFSLKQFALDQGEHLNCYIHGPFGCGKSHLLHSACKLSESSIYIGLNDLKKQPEILEYVHQFDLVCIDDIHSIAAQCDWESALMALCEKIKGSRCRLLVSADVPPGELGFKLRDLTNRFSAAQILKLKSISQHSKSAALVSQASTRGLSIDNNVIDFIMTRYPRDMHSLMRLLGRIERLSLEKHRNITIPFLKQLDS